MIGFRGAVCAAVKDSVCVGLVSEGLYVGSLDVLVMDGSYMYVEYC